MFKNLKKDLIIVLALLILFLVMGSISASEDTGFDLSSEQSSDSIEAESDSENSLESSNSDIIGQLIENENQNTISANVISNEADLTDSKNFSDDENNHDLYENSIVEANPIKSSYTSGNISYKVKLYNAVYYGGVKYKEPLHNATIKIKVYTGNNYKTYSGTINYDVVFTVKIPKLALGTHKVLIYLGNKLRASSSIKVIKSSTKVIAPSKTVKLKKSNYFKMKVLDSSNNAVKNIYLKVKVYTGKKYKTYAIKTNVNGLAKLQTKNLALGTHKILIYANNKKYKIKKTSKIIVTKAGPKSTKEKTAVSAPSKTVKYKQSTYFNIKVLDTYKEPVKNLTLKVKVYTGKKYKTYAIKTNVNGLAKLQTKNLALGTHKVTIKTTNKKYNVSKSSSIKVNKTLVSNKIEATKLYSLQYYEKTDDVFYAKLTWYSKKGNQYLVLRKSNDSFDVVSTVKGNSDKTTYYDKVANDFMYTYSVREFIIKGTDKVVMPYDCEGLRLMNRTNVTVDFTNLRATVKWDNVDGATSYRVFRKIGREGSYECIAVVDKDNLNYTDYYYKSTDKLKSIMNADVFIDSSFNSLFYTVRAYASKKVDSVTKASYGLYFPDGDFHLEAPSIVSLNGNVIKWGRVPNADGYIILKRNALEDEWEEIGQAVQKTSTCISMALDEIDNTAYYTVKAFANKNGKIVYSLFDEGFSLRNYKEEYSNYSILYFGDSITYGSPYKSVSSRHIFSIPNRVAELLGCNFYNPSIPGSTYHDLGTNEDGSNIENTDYYRYRICREVVDQIANGELPGNWEDLDTSANSLGQTNTSIYDYDIVVLAAGTNDYLDNSILGDENSTNTTTFNGALNHILEQILNASQKRIDEGKEAIKVVFVDLYYSDRTYHYKELVNRDVTPNQIGLTLMDYQEALDKQYEKWQSLAEGNLTFYNFNTRDYDIVNQENCPYTSSDNLHFTKYTYGQYGNAFAQFLVDEVF